MKARSRLKVSTIALCGAKFNPEAVELVEGLNGDEQLDLARELERLAQLIHDHLGTNPAKANPPEAESAACWVMRNVWLKVGVSPNQARQLKALSRKIVALEHRTSAEAAKWIISHGLNHIELLLTAVGGFKVQSKLTLAKDESLLDERARARLGHLN